MINAEEKAKINSVLGWSYSAQILEYMKMHRIVAPQTGRPYSQSAIRLTMCGEWDNPIIENAIIDLMVIVRAEKKKQQKERAKKLQM